MPLIDLNSVPNNKQNTQNNQNVAGKPQKQTNNVADVANELDNKLSDLDQQFSQAEPEMPQNNQQQVPSPNQPVGSGMQALNGSNQQGGQGNQAQGNLQSGSLGSQPQLNSTNNQQVAMNNEVTNQVSVDDNNAQNVNTNVANIQQVTGEQVRGQQSIEQINTGVEPQHESLERLQVKEYTLHELLDETIAKEASDIHLTVDYKAVLRISGKLYNIPTKRLTPKIMAQYAKEVTKVRPDIKVDEVTEVDLSYAHKGRRFRVNVFKEMGNFAIVARLIPKEIKTIDELGLPEIFHDFTKVPAGLILVTGPTGSGKSTTLAAIINEINTAQRQHIVTVEDPIEFVYPEKQSVIEQREMGLDFSTFPQALKSLLRQDPNVILVGEMRDYETISSAITVAETGHLVFATLHTNSAPQSIDRIIDVFPEAQQAQIRSQLANIIVAIVAQRLVKLNDGGRTAVHEVMLATPAVKNAIREEKTYQIDNMIQTGQDVGMMQMEKKLADLVRSNRITREEAFAVTVKPKELEILLNQ